MFSGYRYFLASLAGLTALFIVFGMGLMIGSDVEEKRYPPYRYASDKPVEIDPRLAPSADAQVLENREPCRDPKGQGESDLCAQWRAAYAAEDSARWTMWSVYVGIAGIAGLLASLYFTKKAVLAAEEATRGTDEALRIAQENAEAAKLSAQIAQRSFENAYKPQLAPAASGDYIRRRFMRLLPTLKGRIGIGAVISIENISKNTAIITEINITAIPDVLNRLDRWEKTNYRLMEGERCYLSYMGIRSEDGGRWNPIGNMDIENEGEAFTAILPIISCRIRYSDPIGVHREMGFAFEPESIVDHRFKLITDPALSYDRKIDRHQD